MGSEFPGKLYREITNEIDTIISYMNLIIYATTFLATPVPAPLSPVFAWRKHLMQAYTSPLYISQSNAALLSVLAMSVLENQPLPPGLTVPQPYFLTKHVREVSSEVVGWESFEEEGFNEFAVVEIGTTLLYGSLGRLLGLVEELVGVWDYGGGTE